MVVMTEGGGEDNNIDPGRVQIWKMFVTKM